ncbi:hypothetical protein, partial [Frankia sp. Cas8]|uniref:hypothetical protein n=1 Tax=unclassified Frankia TaxID=2632575 RepID=UPI003A102954
PRDAAIALTGVTTDDAVTFYRQTMPTDGYQLKQQSVSANKAKLTFIGHRESVELLANSIGGTPHIVLIFIRQ